MARKRVKRIPTGRVFQKKYRDRSGVQRLSSTFFGKFYRDGKAVEFSTHTEDYEEALSILRSKMATRLEPHHGEQARVRVSHLLDLVVAAHRYKRRKSAHDTELRIDKHLRARLGEMRAVDLTPAEVRKYARARLSEKAAPSTINKELAMLRHGLRLGYREVPPLVANVIHIEMLPVDNVRKGTLSHEQYRAVRDLLPAYARIALVIAYHTGARKGEIVGIRREHIDLVKKRILLSETKGGKPRYLPIYGDMVGELELAVAAMKPGCPWLLQETTKGKPAKNGRRGRPARTTRVESFRKVWKAACDGAKVAGALFHDLRRTAVTNMIEAGFSEKEAMEVSGHRTRSVFDRYHIVSERRLNQMGELLGAHLAAKEEAVKAEEAKTPKGRAS